MRVIYIVSNGKYVPIYVLNLNRRQATEILSKKKVGAFLIRESSWSESSNADYFVISMFDESGKVVHHLFEIDEQGHTYLVCGTLTTHKKEKFDISKLINRCVPYPLDRKQSSFCVQFCPGFFSLVRTSSRESHSALTFIHQGRIGHLLIRFGEISYLEIGNEKYALDVHDFWDPQKMEGIIKNSPFIKKQFQN